MSDMDKNPRSPLPDPSDRSDLSDLSIPSISSIPSIASPGPPPRPTRHASRWIARALALAVVAAYLLSGVYVVRPGEIGVERLFGKVVSTMIEGKSAPALIPPGLHYRLPYPVTRLDLIRVMETRTVAVGFDQMDQILGRDSDSRRSEFLTGDQNIMQLRLTIQYAIGDPIAFLFGATDPEALLRVEAENCLSKAVASIGVDDLIGAGRAGVSAAVRAGLERELALHNPGLRLSEVSFQAPAPPPPVADAFNDVQSAKAERTRLALEAEAYQNDLVTRSHGEAGKALREGEAYRQRRVTEAQGEAKRFEDLYEEYRQAKSVTSLRLYIEAMEEILPQLKKVFIDSDEKGGPLDIGILNAKP